MLDNEIIKVLMRRTKTNQVELSERTGFGSQVNISSLLKAKSLRVAVFTKMCNEMGYEVFVRQKGNPDSEEFRVTYDEESIRSKRANKGNSRKEEVGF